MIRKFLQKLAFPNSYNNEAFVKYLKKKGITIGEGCIFFSPNTTYIDIQRPHGMQVGNYVKIASGVSILCHDYARSVLCSLKEYGNVGEFKQTVIGNNVFIGMNSIILMGSKIGNNSIVGAGSIVSGTFPDDSIICGNPAKRICSLDEYYQKRKLKEVSEAKEFVILWRKLYHRNPTIDEMTNSFAWLYLPRDRNTIIEHPNLFNLSGIDKEVFLDTFMKTKPIYNSFEDFLNDVREKL